MHFRSRPWEWFGECDPLRTHQAQPANPSSAQQSCQLLPTVAPQRCPDRWGVSDLRLLPEYTNLSLSSIS